MSSDQNPVQHSNPKEAWDALKDNASSVLVDVRSRPEWSFVGVPDLSDLGKDLLMVEWRQYPDMQINEKFADALLAETSDETDEMYFICRSGARSLDAARFMSVQSSKNGKPIRCVNVEEGFEGDLDTTRHRGGLNGWKSVGLPWKQS